MRESNCANCNKKCQEDREYQLTKAKGKDAGHWHFCTDVCLYLWLIHYNKLLPLIANREEQ